MQKVFFIFLFIAFLVFPTNIEAQQQAIHCQSVEVLVDVLDEWKEVSEIHDEEVAEKVIASHIRANDECDALTSDVLYEAPGERVPLFVVDELNEETNRFSIIRWNNQAIYCLVTEAEQNVPDPCTYSSITMINSVE